MSKGSNPQLLTWGPTSSWLLIQGWTLSSPIRRLDRLQVAPYDPEKDKVVLKTKKMKYSLIHMQCYS